MNPLIELKRLGQSVWYDNLRRAIITSGELGRMINEYGVSGVTSNPSIFEKAVSGGAEYDADISALARDGLSTTEVLDNIISTDIRLAAETFLPVFNSSAGMDGFVSLEVSPELARDAASTIAEAKRLHALIGKPNIMIKVLGTAPGLAAIEELIYEGININVTLLFSVKRYADVALAYVKGLERRLANGRPLTGIKSVASFFVSRVDTLADRLIEDRMKLAASNDERARLGALVGRTAVANAKLAYVKYIDIFGSKRFNRLSDAGAAPQRLLWASTGTKNPAYSDVKYIEDLIEPATVNTMPLATMLAFLEHGRIARTLPDGLGEAGSVIAELGGLGVDYDVLTSTLENEGIKSFADAYAGLINCVDVKMKAAARPERRPAPTPVVPASGRPSAATAQFSLGGYEDAIDSALAALTKARFSARLWAKDASLWKKTPAEKKQIKNALGWLEVAELLEAHKSEISAFAAEVKDAGFTNAVLLGMGGSSLAPLVMVGSLARRKGYPGLIVLDSTDPDSIASVMKRIDLAKTLFIVASKSGTTIEPLSFFEYFYDKLRVVKGDGAGENFAAITDPGTTLEGFYRKYKMRRLFTNPPDIGGRFSALSYFGLVPAAIAGIDIDGLLYHANRMSVEMRPECPARDNPGVMLGAVIGALAKTGRSKLTFFSSEELKTFGLWIEQLLAESTGKEGVGIVPITNEPAGKIKDYGTDRVFVYIGLEGSPCKEAKLLAGLEKAGHPVIRFALKDARELGGEFLRWETATAAAGMSLGINPFDQPDVEFAKQLTRARLENANTKKTVKASGVEFKANGVSAWFGRTAFKKMTKAGANLKGKGLKNALRHFIGLSRPGDYAGLLAYYNTFDASADKIFTRLRKNLRDGLGCAVQGGYGPRYLHSTGQLHKGGPDNGLFIIIAHETPKETLIPGRPFGFTRLELSQAFGDAEAIDSKGRRVVLLLLKDSKTSTLKEAASLLKGTLQKN